MRLMILLWKGDYSNLLIQKLLSQERMRSTVEGLDLTGWKIGGLRSYCPEPEKHAGAQDMETRVLDLCLPMCGCVLMSNYAFMQ